MLALSPGVRSLTGLNISIKPEITVTNESESDKLKVSTSGRSEGEGGRRPRERADLTELRNFSPTLDKSMAPPWESKKGSKKKTRELSNPLSLKSPLKRKGLPRTLPKGNRLLGCCIDISQLEAPRSDDDSMGLACPQQDTILNLTHKLQPGGAAESDPSGYAHLGIGSNRRYKTRTDGGRRNLMSTMNSNNCCRSVDFVQLPTTPPPIGRTNRCRGLGKWDGLFFFCWIDPRKFSFCPALVFTACSCFLFSANGKSNLIIEQQMKYIFDTNSFEYSGV